MREGADPRLPLELALVRICRPPVELSLEALQQRLERLEVGAAPAPAPAPPPAAASAPPRERGRRRATAGRGVEPPGPPSQTDG